MWELRAHRRARGTRTRHAARVCQERRAKIFQRHTVGRVARACARAAPLAQPRSARGHAQDLAVRRVRAVTLRSSLLGGRGGREADMVRSLCSWGAPPLRRCAPRFARPVPWTPQATLAAGRAWSGSAPAAAPSVSRGSWRHRRACPDFPSCCSLSPCAQLPLSLLRTAQGHPMLIELKNGETYNGHLVSCDTVRGEA